MSDKKKSTTENVSDDTRIYVNNVLGMELPIRVPASLDAIIKILGLQAAWEALLQTLLYRRWNGEFRSQLAERLESETGVTRRQEIDAAGKAVWLRAKADTPESEWKPKLITEKLYINELILGGHIDSVDVERIAREIAENIPVDFSPRTRELKPTAQNRKDAGTLVSLFESGKKDPNAFVTSWERFNSQKFDGDPMSVEDVACALRIHEETKKKQTLGDF